MRHPYCPAAFVSAARQSCHAAMARLHKLAHGARIHEGTYMSEQQPLAEYRQLSSRPRATGPCMSAVVVTQDVGHVVHVAGIGNVDECGRLPAT